jgi:hypothetical protein
MLESVGSRAASAAEPASICFPEKDRAKLKEDRSNPDPITIINRS